MQWVKGLSGESGSKTAKQRRQGAAKSERLKNSKTEKATSERAADIEKNFLRQIFKEMLNE